MELTDRLNCYGDEFKRMLTDDPLKAAGIIALAYIGLRVSVTVLRVLWKLRWVIAVALAVAGIAYALRGRNVPLAKGVTVKIPEFDFESVSNLSKAA